MMKLKLVVGNSGWKLSAENLDPVDMTYLAVEKDDIHRREIALSEENHSHVRWKAKKPRPDWFELNTTSSRY